MFRLTPRAKKLAHIALVTGALSSFTSFKSKTEYSLHSYTIFPNSPIKTSYFTFIVKEDPLRLEINNHKYLLKKNKPFPLGPNIIATYKGTLNGLYKITFYIK